MIIIFIFDLLLHIFNIDSLVDPYILNNKYKIKMAIAFAIYKFITSPLSTDDLLSNIPLKILIFMIVVNDSSRYNSIIYEIHAINNLAIINATGAKNKAYIKD
jgi:hypothetical protein